MNEEYNRDDLVGRTVMIYVPNILIKRLDRICREANAEGHLKRSVVVSAILMKVLGMEKEVRYLRDKYGDILQYIDQFNKNCVK